MSSAKSILAREVGFSVLKALNEAGMTVIPISASKSLVLVVEEAKNMCDTIESEVQDIQERLNTLEDAIGGKNE